MSAVDEALAAGVLARLRSFVRKRVSTDGDADDVVQDVMTRFLRRAPDRPESVHAWLFTVARRALIDRGRRAKGDAALEAVEACELASDPQPEAAQELATCLDPLLRLLPEADQHLLRQVDMDGKSQAAIARELGASPSGLRSRVQRARTRLRVALERCCEIDLDRRGSPAAFQRRSGGGCGCRGDC